MAGRARGLALFDLDLTLLPIDSDHAWGEFMVTLGWAEATSFRAGNDAFYADYRAGRLDIEAYIAFATAPLIARSAAERAAGRERFMREVVAPAIRPEAMALVAIAPRARRPARARHVDQRLRDGADRRRLRRSTR